MLVSVVYLGHLSSSGTSYLEEDICYFEKGSLTKGLTLDITLKIVGSEGL